VAKENAHELNGDGLIILNGADVGAVYYWLSIRRKPGRIIAEGLISGPEPVPALDRRSVPAHETERGCRPSTPGRRLAAIRNAHRLSGFEPPTDRRDADLLRNHAGLGLL
jgi:hypothetical protein